MPNWEDQKSPYPLNWDEQTRFFQELPEYLERMAIFAVNTGLREQGVCWLRWDWETKISELQTSVFVIPGRPEHYSDGVWLGEKNKEDQVVVLNRAARSVVEACRGNGSELCVFIEGEATLRNAQHSMEQRMASGGVIHG